MTPWRRIVTLAAVGCLIAGAALAQQTMPPPNQPRKLEPPNTPREEPSHWGRPVEPKEPKRDAPTAQRPPEPPKPPRPPADADEDAARRERPPR
jgi:hypothetical protein